MRNSGLPPDVLVGKLKKDISFALRRGTIAQVTSQALDAAPPAEDELALNEAGLDYPSARYTLVSDDVKDHLVLEASASSKEEETLVIVMQHTSNSSSLVLSHPSESAFWLCLCGAVAPVIAASRRYCSATSRRDDSAARRLCTARRERSRYTSLLPRAAASPPAAPSVSGVHHGFCSPEGLSIGLFDSDFQTWRRRGPARTVAAAYRQHSSQQATIARTVSA